MRQLQSVAAPDVIGYNARGFDVTSRTILIAGGDRTTRTRFDRALTTVGHRVTTAAAAADLIGAIDSVDLVLLDLRLAGTDGLDLVRTIRAHPGRRVPVLVFAGSVRTAEAVKDLAALDVAGYVNESCAAEQIPAIMAPHLFPDNFNRRGSHRVALGIPIAFRGLGSITAAMTLDLGKGGVAVQTMTPLECADKVVTQFRLPGSDRDIATESHVAWSDRRVGMGLQFEHLAASDQGAIDAFVDRHIAALHAR